MSVKRTQETKQCELRKDKTKRQGKLPEKEIRKAKVVGM